MQYPQVTIITPTFNRKNWIQDCINDAIDQSYPNLQIVVVDDGSQDQTFEKVLELIDYKNVDIESSHDEPKILVIGKTKRKQRNLIAAKLNKNYGPSFARNYGIKTSWGDSDAFVLFDSDDRFDTAKVEKSIKLMMKDWQNIGVVYCDYMTTSAEFKTLNRVFLKSYDREFLIKEDIVSSHALINKLALAKVGLFDEEMVVAEDWDLFLRIAEHFVLAHLPESLVTMRVGSHDSSHIRSPEIWNKNYRRVLEKIEKRKSNG